jgi:AraC-like DNA-binding protein
VPFVVVLLLCIVWLRLVRQGGGSETRIFRVFVAACALASVIMGLRWNLHLSWAQALQPVVAATLPPLAWACRSAMVGALRWSLAWHGLGILLVWVLALVWRGPIDLVLMLMFLVYGLALIRKARLDADRLARIRLGDVGDARHALMLIGGLFVASALVDLLMAVDFEWGSGLFAPHIIAVAGVLQLLGLGWAMAWIHRAQPGLDKPSDSHGSVPGLIGVQARPVDGMAPQSAVSKTSSDRVSDGDSVVWPADSHTLQRFEHLMRDAGFYRDPDLTLDRIARRRGIPARQVSAAVNAAHGCNVSQVVNRYRVAHAQLLLRETGTSVTEVMQESGFQTKSNFNREFRRLVGMSPSDFRAQTVVMEAASRT